MGQSYWRQQDCPDALQRQGWNCDLDSQAGGRPPPSAPCPPPLRPARHLLFFCHLNDWWSARCPQSKGCLQRDKGAGQACGHWHSFLFAPDTSALASSWPRTVPGMRRCPQNGCSVQGGLRRHTTSCFLPAASPLRSSSLRGDILSWTWDLALFIAF